MEIKKMILFTAIALAITFSTSFAEDKSAVQPQVKKSAGQKILTAESMQGRVIFLNNESIEIKKGRTEIILFFAEGTRFVNTAGEEKSIDIIRLCQTVKASYTKEGDKNILQKITVIKESNCIK